MGTDLHFPLKVGCWNTWGWPNDSNFRNKVIHSLDLDSIGVCETFLRDDGEIHLEGYTSHGLVITESKYRKEQFEVLGGLAFSSRMQFSINSLSAS